MQTRTHETKETAPAAPEEADPEYQRGYNEATYFLRRDPSGAQGYYNASANALDQDAFDLGWRKACVEHGAKEGAK